MEALNVVNPFTLEVDRSYPLESLSSVQEKVTRQRNDQSAWAKLSVRDRLVLVEGALAYFEQNREQIAEDICRQMGRPRKQALGEINGLLERARFMCSVGESVLNPDHLPQKAGFERSIDHAPYGLIFIMSAWNYPLLITINSVIPALISGNVVLLKHSSQTPEIGRHFEKAFSQLGNFKNLLQNVVIDHKTSGAVIESGMVDHVIFTGSVGGGKSILRHCAEALISPNLELGGKDAAYVDKEVNIQHAVETIVDGAVFNSGQSCCGIERTYVHEAVYEEFIAKAKELMRSYVMGDPMDEKTNLGPLVNKKAAAPMIEQIEKAVAGGARILTGGKVQIISQSTFFPPTLIVDVKQEMDLIQEENFGPILPVIAVKSMQEAVSKVNDSKFGLTSAIFTNNRQTAEEFYRQADTGTVFMNRCDYLDPELPWTGVRQSGCGSSLSKYGYFGVTRLKGKHFRLEV